jgi:pimeloyl-ACP methyl ester carboxylesterase
VFAVALLTLVVDTFEVRAITVAPAETLRTVSLGTGDPVVFIPGLLGGAFGYRRVMRGIASRPARAIVIEPLGSGESSRPGKADYSLTAQSQRVALVRDSLGLGPVWVVAQSLGAPSALRLGYAHPERVKGILLIDGGPAESAAPPGLRRAMRFAPLLKLFVGRGTIRRSIRNGILANSGDSAWVTEEVLEGYTAAAARNVGATIDAFRGMARSREPESLHDHLQEIRVPVRLMLGTAPHESGLSTAEVDSLAAALGDRRLKTVPGAGQYLHEERPDAVMEALAGLMDSRGPGPEPAQALEVGAGNGPP